MPPRSKAQAAFMRAVANGDRNIPGLSRDEANEYVSGYRVKTLPTRVHKKKRKKA